MTEWTVNNKLNAWYQKRYHIKLPKEFETKAEIYFGGSSFSPSALFALAEPGVWFDPSDLTTLFQDPAGTTAVTAPGNTVGLMLDKSKGLALGSEVYAPLDFNSGWTSSGSVVTIDDADSFTTPGVSNLFSTAFTVGRWYRITFKATFTTPGLVLYNSNTASNGISPAIVSGQSFTVLFNAVDTRLNIRATGAGTVNVDNISVRELPGNHATQATLASRPTYGIEPVGGRRNLLTFSEDLSNVVWSKSGLTPSGSLTVVEDTATSIKFTRQSSFASLVSGAGYSFSFKAKRGTGSRNVVVNFVNAPVNNTGVNIDLGSGLIVAAAAGITASIQPAEDGFFYVSGAYTGNGTSAGYRFDVVPNSHTGTSGVSYTGDGVSSVQIKETQLETGSTDTNYQRVTTQYDVTEAGVASVSYLYFDGASDNMVTSTITPGTDKAQVFAGVRKLSDATGIIAETSATVETNAGSLILYSNPNIYGAKTRGSLNISAAVSPAAYTAPTTNVLTGTGDIAGDNFTLRINGIQAAQITENQGTGDFLAYPLFIGRRDNGVTSPSYPFSGHLYSLITRFGPTLDAPTITSTEIWVGDKTGIDVAKNISTTIFARDNTAILDRANSTIERRAV